jgi:hypothetical protein
LRCLAPVFFLRQAACYFLKAVRHKNLFNNQVVIRNSGAFFAANAAKNRAFRSKSSDLLMQILRAFRCNPLRGRQRL